MSTSYCTQGQLNSSNQCFAVGLPVKQTYNTLFFFFLKHACTYAHTCTHTKHTRYGPPHISRSLLSRHTGWKTRGRQEHTNTAKQRRSQRHPHPVKYRQTHRDARTHTACEADRQTCMATLKTPDKKDNTSKGPHTAKKNKIKIQPQKK